MLTIWQRVHKNRTFFFRHQVPCRTAMQKLVEKCELLEQASDVKNKTRARRSCIAEIIAAVAVSVKENSDLFIPRRSLKLGILQTSLQRILLKG